MYNNFSSRLQKLRNKKGFSIRHLARNAHLSSSYLSKLEHGIRTPKPSTLRKLAHGLRVPASKLFAMAGIEPEQSNNSSPDKINLDDAFANHKEFTYHNKKVSPETIKYLKRVLGGGSK